MGDKEYRKIVQHCETCLEEHGDSAAGVDWPTRESAAKRYEVMLDMVDEESERVSLLDFGCGTAALNDVIVDRQLDHITYSGLDLSGLFLKVCHQKYPDTEFLDIDVLDEPEQMPEYDYIVLNGIFTFAGPMEHAEMADYMRSLLDVVFRRARVGVAFNVMTELVDWEDDQLFYLPLTEAAQYLEELSRHFIIRHDYGLYEYTVYLYHEAR